MTAKIEFLFTIIETDDSIEIECVPPDQCHSPSSVARALYSVATFAAHNGLNAAAAADCNCDDCTGRKADLEAALAALTKHNPVNITKRSIVGAAGHA